MQKGIVKKGKLYDCFYCRVGLIYDEAIKYFMHVVHFGSQYMFERLRYKLLETSDKGGEIDFLITHSSVCRGNSGDAGLASLPLSSLSVHSI